ncbi:signal recognition particle subunit srp68 [Neonectria punicea]|uniref:Signal recognition particle subunit SRP68 n=1 Tax=Neonectria punicea TaxID=979145 RepID=A0ABR1HBE2_9HYPO
MDITNFVVQGRDKALLNGDYSTYHGLLSKRLLNCRKKLGLATKNRGKFHPKSKVTPDEVAQNHGYVQFLLLTSERAWAQAMSIKSTHSTDQKGITGRTRSHIVSRLTKAARNADDLVDVLSESDSGATSTDLLEAKAYAALIRGSMLFEKQSWEPSLRSYATARIVYSALATTTKGDIFKDLLSETIDPSIRYSAYQLNTPRTVPIPVIAQRAFPHSDTALVQEINQIDVNLLKQGETDLKKESPGAEDAPKTLTWRSREVTIEDAQIAVAWGFVLASKERLATTLAEPRDRSPSDLSAAYDEILSATQDAVDATKQAIDEMRAEGIEQGDPRMQSLQITRTAVNFEMISWRIGRNRVLTGSNDGAVEEYGPVRRRRARTSEEPAKQEKELPIGKKLGKLKEKVALYAGILQSIEAIKELPGVANDQELASQIDSFVKYFEALKALSVARSHAIIGKCANALGLIHHAFGLSGESLPKVPKPGEASTKGVPLSLTVEPEAVQFLHKLLDGERQRYRSIVYIDELRTDKKEDAEDDVKRPLVETLQDYPINGVELANIVEYPPKMALIPMKPIFLDVAWNYIEYPGKAAAEREAAPAKEGSKDAVAPGPQQPAKRGWFGFGRS